jgi:hypothetical protein
VANDHPHQQHTHNRYGCYPPLSFVHHVLFLAASWPGLLPNRGPRRVPVE